MGLFQTKASSLNDQKGILDILSGINHFYSDASVRNHKLNEHKILLYKYLKWPERYDSKADERQNVLVNIPANIDKQIKAFKIALNSLRKAKSLLSKNSEIKDAPPIYTRYIQLVETMILETEREVVRLLPMFETQRDLIKSKSFKNFSSSNLLDPTQKKEYDKFIDLFDQERDIYKTLTTVIVPKYHQYQAMQAEMGAYVQQLAAQYKKITSNDTKKIETVAATAFGICTIAGAVASIISFFLYGSDLLTPSMFVNMLELGVVTAMGGGIGALGGAAVGGTIETSMNFLRNTVLSDSLKAAMQVNAAFD